MLTSAQTETTDSGALSASRQPISSQPVEDAGSFLRMKSDKADTAMTPMERENAIELFELREAWFEFEGLHDKAAEARQIHQSLAAGRNYQGAK